MLVVDFPNLAPSVCIVCESVPPATAFVDTLNNFSPAALTQLNGRKYLCASCIRDAAAALGLFEEVLAPVQAAKDEHALVVSQLQADLADMKAIEALMQAIGSRPVVNVSLVEPATKAAKDKTKALADTAQKASQAVKDAQDASDAGAKLQIELDKALAASVSERSLAPKPPAAPEADLSITGPPDPILNPVTPVGQVEYVPADGEVWDGEKWSYPEPASKK